jgi:hypothetical protein
MADGERFALYACPKHVPIGVTLRIEPAHDGYRLQKIVAVPCPKCKNPDPIEDIRFERQGEARLWGCHLCRTRWSTISTEDTAQVGELRVQPYATVLAFLKPKFEAANVEVEALVFREAAWMQATGMSTPPELSGVALRFHELPVHSQSVSGVTELPESIAILVLLRDKRARTAHIQRLGGQPDRSGVVGARPDATARSLHEDFERTFSRNGGNADAALSAAVQRMAFTEPHRPPAPTEAEGPPTEKGSRWTQKSGEHTIASSTASPLQVQLTPEPPILVEILDVELATDGTNVVVFRRVTHEGDAEPSVRLNRRDFIRAHRPWVPDLPAPPPAAIEVHVGEEWASTDGDELIVTSVDPRKEIVHGDDPKAKRKRQIPFSQFAGDKWRRIIRKSALARILEQE